MGTPNTSSGSHLYPAIGAPDNNLQQVPAHDSNMYHQKVASLQVPRSAYQCSCKASQGQDHSQQCLGYNVYTNQRILQAPQPHEHPHWTYDNGPSSQLRLYTGYELTGVPYENSSSSNGGHIEQPAPQADPMEVETQREANDGGAQRLNSTAQHQGPPEHGPQNADPYGVSNQDEHSALPEVHACCSTPCPKYDSNYQLVSCSALSHPSYEKKSGNGVGDRFWRWTGLGSNEEWGHSRPDTYSGSSRKDREAEQSRKHAELEEKLKQHSAESNKVAKRKDEELRRKDEELKRKDEELTRKDEESRRKDEDQRQAKSKNAQELEMYQNAVKSHKSQVTMLTTKVTEYRTNVNKMTAQLSSLEQQNSKAVGGTGAHKDTPAIPPNLVKSVFVVNEVALTSTKTFITFLKGRGKALEKHEALQNLPVGADERYRKYAVEAYLCSRLFAGFENDSYLGGLDCVQGSERFLPPDYQQTDFFLQNQDPEKRRQRYLEEYDSLQNLGLQKVMEDIKTTKAHSTNAFLLFCCRKLVNVMSSSLDAWFEEFGLLESIDYSKKSLLYHLASNPKYCEKFLKPFVNLAMVTFLLHRLAFQFKPPARIFRYAVGARFDPTYMENAVPIDDGDSDDEVVVGLMLVPGFQVGATIVKCTVYLVPSSSQHAS